MFPPPLWKTFRSKLNTIPVSINTVHLPTGTAFTFDRNTVRNHTGMVFDFRPESRSPSTGFRMSGLLFF
jgi:hypothetical protein